MTTSEKKIITTSSDSERDYAIDLRYLNVGYDLFLIGDIMQLQTKFYKKVKF